LGGDTGEYTYNVKFERVLDSIDDLDLSKNKDSVVTIDYSKDHRWSVISLSLSPLPRKILPYYFEDTVIAERGIVQSSTNQSFPTIQQSRFIYRVPLIQDNIIYNGSGCQKNSIVYQAPALRTSYVLLRTGPVSEDVVMGDFVSGMTSSIEYRSVTLQESLTQI